mmetsp:Transcript_53975/g.152099  ORF Transcript_53975/g.152099 Transcript_53975/m.152099 type:complete len:230 (+) Transcript_53975:435-1124(+)
MVGLASVCVETASKRKLFDELIRPLDQDDCIRSEVSEFFTEERLGLRRRAREAVEQPAILRPRLVGKFSSGPHLCASCSIPHGMRYISAVTVAGPCDTPLQQAQHTLVREQLSSRHDLCCCSAELCVCLSAQDLANPDGTRPECLPDHPCECTLARCNSTYQYHIHPWHRRQRFKTTHVLTDRRFSDRGWCVLEWGPRNFVSWCHISRNGWVSKWVRHLHHGGRCSPFG